MLTTRHVICRLSKAAEHGLWYYRMGCLGETTSKLAHHHLDDCPALRHNPFFKCDCCMKAKSTYAPVPKQSKRTKPPSKPPEPDTKQEPTSDQTSSDKPVNETAYCTPITEPSDTVTDTAEETCEEELEDCDGPDDADCIPNLQPGQWFQMDMGFVRGSGFSIKEEDGRQMTSLDGYNSYLIIIDRKTRYQWIFLMKNKVPPIEFVKSFLEKNACKTTSLNIIQSDQGRELYRSPEFQQMVKDKGFIMEPTATDASYQNGVVECPYCTFRTVMRLCLQQPTLDQNTGRGPFSTPCIFEIGCRTELRKQHHTLRGGAGDLVPSSSRSLVAQS